MVIGPSHRVPASALVLFGEWVGHTSPRTRANHLIENKQEHENDKEFHFGNISITIEQMVRWHEDTKNKQKKTPIYTVQLYPPTGISGFTPRASSSPRGSPGLGFDRGVLGRRSTISLFLHCCSFSSPRVGLPQLSVSPPQRQELKKKECHNAQCVCSSPITSDLRVAQVRR